MPPCSVPLLPLPLESMADPDRSLNCQLPPNVAALAWVCHPKVDANARKAAVIVAVRVARLMCRAPARWDDADRTSRLHDRNGPADVVSPLFLHAHPGGPTSQWSIRVTCCTNA